VFTQTGASDPLWSRDGTRLAVVVGTGVQVLDREGTIIQNIGSAVRPAWSPDSKSLAVVKVDGSTGVPIIVDLASGSQTTLSASIEPHSPDYPIAWHPAGAVIAYRDRAYEPATGTERSLIGTAIGWSPDGRMLIVALPEPGELGTTVFRLLDATQDLKEVIGFELPPSTDATPGWLFVENWIVWGPDGRLLVYMDPTPTRERVRMYDTVEPGQDVFTNIRGEQPDVSPDGAVITFMNQGKVWVLPLDGSSLNAVADGGFPAWVPVTG
jgi:Tol biopolymer transport system component